jgi:hypothetical protein
MRLGRSTDRLSPEERDIVDRFERGVIDAAEAGRLLIESVRYVEPTPDVIVTPDVDEGGVPGETPEEARARVVAARTARDVYEDPPA